MPKTFVTSVANAVLGAILALAVWVGFSPAAKAQEELRVVLLGTGSPPPRVVEGAARFRVWLPSACPDGAMFRKLAARFAIAEP